MAEIGSTLGGRYRLIELLGQGGMATIFRAHDAQLQRDIAVKLLRPQYGRDPDFLARFREEARSAGGLSHPNVVQVYDYGQDDDGPYIVMELVEGEDLASILRDTGGLPPRQAARISAEAAKALHAAHGRGIVHRDVKPSNILVSRDARVKVADFGIARALAESQLTMPGTTLGSVHYFSPEQARGEPATPASDIYSLGIVLYESLTGQRPFTGDGAAAVAMARLSGPAPRPSDVRPSVPPALDAIVMRAMAPDPIDRFASAAALANALEAFLSDRPEAAIAAAGAAGGLGAAASAAPAGEATVASAAARPNPLRPVPYAPDAYADAGPPPPAYVAPVPRSRAPIIEPDPEPDDAGTSPWAWVAGLLGLLILAVVALLLFQLLTSPGGTAEPSGSPSAGLVEVPSFVDLSFADAAALAEQSGLTIEEDGTEERTDVAAGTILSQDPAAGESIAEGGIVRVVVAVGPEDVVVPTITGLTEQQAIVLLAQEGLSPGLKSEAFDDIVPLDSIIDQSPDAGLIAAPGTVVDYTVSLGPEPSPSPSPTPSPTPAPTPPPTPPPTPGPRNTGDYTCITLADARDAIAGDGFEVGDVTGVPDGYTPVDESIVVDQDPNPGVNRPAGSSVDLTVTDPLLAEAGPPCGA